MPTAVLVGMGLTPRLALADEKDIPFAPGPCVTRSDAAAEEEQRPPRPSESGSGAQSSEPSDGPSSPQTPDPGPGGSDSPGDGESDGDGDREGAEGSGRPGELPSAREAADAARAAREEAAEARRPVDRKPTATPTPTPTPTPTAAVGATGPGRSRDPWDPLGLGDALKDLFGVPDGKKPPAATPPAKPPATTSPATSRPGKPPEKPADRPGRPAGPPAGDRETRPPSGGPAKRPAATPGGTAADRARKGVEDAAARAGAEVRELDEGAGGLVPRKDQDIPEGAKPRLPCATPDPEALAAAEEEPGIPAVPDDPWILKSSLLTLKGLKYHGIVEVRTGGGELKPALKFTATGVDIRDLHQLAVGPLGRTMHAEARKGSTSTITDGTVTMYTEELTGNLFGIFPVTFSPRTPPPLDIPYAYFTRVTVVQAGQFGGRLTVPGLRNYLTDGQASG
ncbi:hypothetical protein ACWDR0_07510 [Streptomyces sp. NPDC003691]